MMRIALVLAVLVSSTPTLAAPTPAETFVGKLAALSCPRVSQLAPAFGPQNYVPKKDEMANLQPYTIPVGDLGKLGVTKVTIQLSYDIYHQTPSTVTDPMVGGIELALDARTDLEKAVAALPGVTHFTTAAGAIYHANQLYYRRGLLLVTCGNPPAWAQQQWTPADVKTMTERVVAVLDRKQVAGFVKDPKDAGRTIMTDEKFELGRQSTWFYVNFKTSMPAKALLEAVGAKRVVLRSGDVHRSHWELRQADGSPIIYNGWNLDIEVDDDKLDKSNKGPVLDIDKLLVSNLNAHPK